MLRLQVEWLGTGFEGGGVSTFYVDGSIGDVPEVVPVFADFLTSLATGFTNGTTMRLTGDATEIDPSTGDVVARVGYTPPAAEAGDEGGATLAPALQVLIRLRTATVRGGRFVQGRVNLGGVPVLAGQYSPSPQYRAARVASFTSLVADLAATPLVVWSRPGDAGAGTIAPVTSVDSWDKYAVLTSRRD